MKFLKFMLLLAMVLVASATSLLEESTDEKDLEESTDEKDLSLDNSYDDHEDSSPPQNFEPATSLRGVSRFLAHKTQKTRLALTTCNRYPRICLSKGSPGPNCCKRRCVNVANDILNCGKCGHKCKYSEICCNGKCINPLKDKKHCGGCNKKCKKGSKCLYGMCGYA